MNGDAHCCSAHGGKVHSCSVVPYCFRFSVFSVAWACQDLGPLRTVHVKRMAASDWGAVVDSEQSTASLCSGPNVC